MSFLTPLFWLGLAAVAAPILVHLVRRTRARRVEFPALLFVRQVPQRTIRRRTLRNLLLLLLRCLIVLLLVIAFTRPFFSGRSAAKESNVGGASVILIDNSLSMRRENLFAEAQRRADSAIADARNDERLALVSFGKRYEVINRFTTDRNQLRAAVKSLSAGWEGTDYEQALRGADLLLNDARTSGPKRVILISDFQAAGWNQANATFKLSAGTQLLTLDVGGGNPPPNIAVTDLEARGVNFSQKYSENMAVHVNNFSDAPRDHLILSFQINDQTVEKREISLAARESKVIEFTGFNLPEGSSRCAIDVASGDFAPDNRFSFTLKREVPAPALIVESAARGRSDSFYLQSALTTNDALPFSFTLKTTGAVDPAALPDYSVVILNDAGELSPALSESLAKRIEAGGQLIIATGPKTEAAGFNRSLQRVAPATLQEAVETKPGESVAITDLKFDHPIFEVFREGRRLAGAHVTGYFRSEPHANAVVLARFEDGSPAMIEARIGKGRALLLTTSLGPRWNDLALTTTYLPLVHQMVRYVGARDDSTWYALGQTFTVAKDAQGAAPAVDSPAGVRLTETRKTPEGDLLVTGREPGFYRLRYSAQPDYVAVDVDGNEGDFTKLDFGQFVTSVTGGSGSATATETNRASTNEEIESRQKVWWSLILTALLILLVESVLSRRIKVAKMVG